MAEHHNNHSGVVNGTVVVHPHADGDVVVSVVVEVSNTTHAGESVPVRADLEALRARHPAEQVDVSRPGGPAEDHERNADVHHIVSGRVNNVCQQSTNHEIVDAVAVDVASSVEIASQQVSIALAVNLESRGGACGKG